MSFTKTAILVIITFLSVNILAETKPDKTKLDNPVNISSKNSSKKPYEIVIQDNFPWKNFIEDKKVNGCIYSNKYYSEGAVLVKDNIPRTCVINANLDSAWAPLGSEEFELYKKYKQPVIVKK